MRVELVVIGTSLGGLRALQVVLGALPRDCPWPVVVAQHRGGDAGDGLTTHLQLAVALPLADADDKEPLAPGRVYLAPAGYHTLVERGHLALSTAGRVQYARPSVDVLFESAADAYGAAVVGVVLTGSGRD